MKADFQGDASELVLELTSPAPSEAFSLFKRSEDGKVTEFKLRVRLLRQEEVIAALRDAQAYAKENGELDKSYGDIYKEAQAVFLMARALCRPEKKALPNGVEVYPQLFTEAKQLRASFTENEIAVCLNAYEVTKAKYRCFEDWSEEDVDKWAARLASGIAPLWLGRLDAAHWPDAMYSLARRVVELSAMIGPPPSTSPSSSESPADGSESGTGGSTESPFVVASDGQKLPDDHLMTKAEADAIVREQRKNTD